MRHGWKNRMCVVCCAVHDGTFYRIYCLAEMVHTYTLGLTFIVMFFSNNTHMYNMRKLDLED